MYFKRDNMSNSQLIKPSQLFKLAPSHPCFKLQFKDFDKADTMIERKRKKNK